MNNVLLTGLVITNVVTLYFLYAACGTSRFWRKEARGYRDMWQSEADAYRAMTDLHNTVAKQLEAERAKRSAAVAKGNRTRAEKRAAAKVAV